VHGPLRDVFVCHCVECRRWSGHTLAATAARRDDVIFVADGGLRWIESPDSDSQAERGFCAECGSSLFWRVSSRETISIAAGALDQPTGLTVARHVYVHERADYLWPHPPFEACDTAGGRA
jgi:hypothetical protein